MSDERPSAKEFFFGESALEIAMTIVIRGHVHIAADRSIRLGHDSFEPGADAGVIVLIESKADQGKPLSFHDAIQNLVIDAPEDYSMNFGGKQQL